MLDGTEWWADPKRVLLGPSHQLLALLHTEGFLVVAHFAFLAVGIRAGISHLSSPGTRAWSILVAATLLGAVVIGSAVVELGTAAALVATLCTLVCLAVAYQLRSL